MKKKKDTIDCSATTEKNSASKHGPKKKSKEEAP